MMNLKKILNNILWYENQTKNIGIFSKNKLLTANKNLVKEVYSNKAFEPHSLSKKIARKFASGHRLSLQNKISVDRKIETKEFYYKKDYSNYGKLYQNYLLDSITKETKDKIDLYKHIDNLVHEHFICDFLGIEDEKKFILQQKLNHIDKLGDDESFLKICFLSALPLPTVVYKKLIPSFYNRYKTYDNISEYLFENYKGGKETLLGELIDLYKKENLTKEEVIGEIKSVVIGAHTLASALIMSLATLSKKEDEQEKIGKSIEYSKLAFFECLRLNGPAYILPYSTESKCPFARSKSIYISVTHLHKNENYWKNPEIFYPSRFQEKIEAHTFIPFGNGVRGCPGKKITLDICTNFLHELFKNVRINLVKEPSYNRTMFRDIDNHELLCNVNFLKK